MPRWMLHSRRRRRRMRTSSSSSGAEIPRPASTTKQLIHSSSPSSQPKIFIRTFLQAQTPTVLLHSFDSLEALVFQNQCAQLDEWSKQAGENYASINAAKRQTTVPQCYHQVFGSDCKLDFTQPFTRKWTTAAHTHDDHPARPEEMHGHKPK